MALIYPSLLAANPAHLDNLIAKLEPLVPGFHIDIMDKVFVPNTGISVENTNKIAKLTIKPLWIHLMVQEPASYLDTLQVPAGSIVTFHIESRTNTPDLIKRISDKGWLPGMAIKPEISINEAFAYLDVLHQVLIMSVKPGFSGQDFLPQTLAKVGPLVGQRQTAGLKFKIAMDGGISIKNITEVASKGVDQLAVGSEIFDHSIGAVEAYKILAAKIA